MKFYHTKKSGSELSDRTFFVYSHHLFLYFGGIIGNCRPDVPIFPSALS